MTSRVKEHASVVRYGNTFYVVADIEGDDHVSREAVEATAIARFPFEGRCVKSNAAAQQAYKDAVSYCKKAAR